MKKAAKKEEIELTEKEKKELPDITPRMALFLRYYTNSKNKKTFSNSTESYLAAGYKDVGIKNRHMAWRVKKRLMPLIKLWLDDYGLSELALQTRMIKGLDVKETRFFNVNGVIEERIVDAIEPQRKYLEMAMKAQGILQPEKHEVSGKIDFNFSECPPEVDEMIQKIMAKRKK